MRELRLIAAAATGYLVGTAPSADLAARLATGGGADVRTMGTGNPGAANVAAVFGKGWGYGVLLADIAKGAVASSVGRRIAGDLGAHVGGTAAVVGHCFPLWKRFRGGKGAATSSGQCLATFPAYFPVDLGVAFVIAKCRKRPFPATIVASLMWVGACALAWRRGWRNGWGPAPTAALPAAAAVSSTVILHRFWAAARAGRPRP